MQPLCGVDKPVCQDVLDVLVARKFLRVNADGTTRAVVTETSLTYVRHVLAPIHEAL